MSLISLLTQVWGPGAEPLVVSGGGGVVGGGNRNPPPLSPRGPGGGVTPRLIGGLGATPLGKEEHGSERRGVYGRNQ
jgi:hypothetical protein